ncbi:MAG TPA: oligogalacturonate lyase family protein [Chitinophagaceae bacterium]|jgi:oligogalacturonide lyase|nr:oligogalacturonate lyase family protein [Chitinophagaceae bacterium]
MKYLICLIAVLFTGAACFGQPKPIPVLPTGGHRMPNAWIDQSTGHEVVKLSRRDGNNRSFYFHNNPFVKTPDGKGWEMLYYGSAGHHDQLFVVNLENDASEQVTHFPKKISGEILEKKNRDAYFQSGDSVFSVNIDSHRLRLVYVFANTFHGHVASVNADGTLLAGVWSDEQERKILQKYPKKGSFFTRIYNAHIPHVLFTINLQTKVLTKIDSEDNWLNHEQFSPVNPDLLLYAHEGPWDKVARTWLINVKTKQKKLLHKRSVKGEINGHEWWAPDGKTVWFDLQIPRSVTFYIAGVNVKTGTEHRYQLKRNEWSIHYNSAPDEQLFCGDGGDPTQVARATDGMWIYLFHPEGTKVHAEKLVNMSYQKYRALEPNVHFSPDGKWVIFRANFEGTEDIYAVKIKKS